MYRTLLTLAVTTITSLLSLHAQAFDSYGVPKILAGPIHGEITEDATKRLGIDDCDDLQEAVRHPDWEQTSVIRLKLRPNDKYRSSNHFDRDPSKSSEQAFKEAAFFVRTEREKCVAFVKAGNESAALASLGRVLHAVQDMVSHSNLIDLTADQRTAALAAVWDETKPVPAELKLTAYDPKAETPGEPKDDYGHDEYSKDNEKKNAEAKLKIDGKTKYKIAYDLAIDLSEQVLRGLKAELGDTAWEKLADKFD
jgi:hypothetical protein